MNRAWIYIVLLIGVFTRPISYAQQSAKIDRILIVLNGGATMEQSWKGGTTKYKAAHYLVTTLIDSMWHINKEVQFGLRVFGHLDPIGRYNCKDSRREVNFTKDNLAQVSLRIEDIKPKGTASVSYALEKAVEEDLINTEKYNYSIILVTDSSSSCKEDICKLAEKLHDITTRTYAVQLESSSKTNYECLGRALDADADEKMAMAITKILEPYRKMFFSSAKTLNAKQIEPAIPQARIVAISKPVIKRDTADVVKQVKPIQSLPIVEINLIKSKREKVTVSQMQEPERPYKYGYVKFVNAAGVNSVIFNIKKSGEYIFDLKFESEDLNNKRFRIREGKYQAEYNGKTKELIIFPNMITELDLR